MGSRVYLLVKIFDREEYADAFIQKGEMFCKTLGDFKLIEDGEVRGDIYEGVTDWHQPDQVSLVISYKDKDGVDQSFPIKDLAGPIVVQNNGYNRLNLYCMYAIKIQDFEESFETEEERLRIVNKINSTLKEQGTLSAEAMSLGEFAVVVYKVEDFIDKVKHAAQEKKYACWNGSITYYNPEKFHGSFNGIKAAFRKRDIYANQNEYRFVFNSNENEQEGAKLIQIGSLETIAIKIPTKDFNKKIELKLVG